MPHNNRFTLPRCAGLATVLTCFWWVHLAMADGIDNAPREVAQRILAETGISGGLVVHLDCGDGRLTAALRASDAYLVEGLDTDAKNVQAARRYISSLGLSGKVTADTFDGEHLPYADNLVNLVLVSGVGVQVSAQPLAWKQRV